MHKLLLGGAAAAIAASAAFAAQTAPPPPPGVAQGTAPVVVTPPVIDVPPAPHVRTFVHRMPMKAKTRGEVAAHVKEMFAKLDTNRDGYVTREEADKAHAAMAGEMRGKIAKRFEMRDLPKPDRGAMFDKLDTNKDGAISRQEFMAAKPQVHERRIVVNRDGPAAAPGTPDVKVFRRPGMPGMAMRMHGRMFERADANRDGRVSLQEATDAALRHFDQADANRDGTLTPDERMRMHRERRVHVERVSA